MKNLKRLDKDAKLLLTAKEFIKRYNRLRYCKNTGLCACLGCINSQMSYNDYLKIKEHPEIKEMLGNIEPSKMSDPKSFLKLFNKL